MTFMHPMGKKTHILHSTARK